MMRTGAMVLVIATAVVANAELRVAEVARGESWVSGYWGYSAPKVAFDGTAYYTVGLWGTAVESTRGSVYRWDGAAWRAGAEFSDIYQPALLLLDRQRRLIVIHNARNRPVTVLRARSPGRIDAFDALPAPAGMENGYYLGAAIDADCVYLAYVALPGYSMFLSSLDLASLTWSAPIVLAEGQTASKPKTAWTYPIVQADAAGVHVAASNSPDGGEGNTYDTVWYVYVARDSSGMRVEKREIVAQSPLGWIAYAMDLCVDAQGAVRVAHMWNVPKYGEPLPSGAPEPGVYDAKRDPQTGMWSHARVAAPCIAGYWRNGDVMQVIYQDAGGIASKTWDATARAWLLPTTIVPKDGGPGVPGFMDVLSAAGGSVLPAGPAIVASSAIENGCVLWSVLP